MSNEADYPYIAWWGILNKYDPSNTADLQMLAAELELPRTTFTIVKTGKNTYVSYDLMDLRDADAAKASLVECFGEEVLDLVTIPYGASR